MSKTLSSITLDSIEHLASSVSALERGRELCNNQKVSDLNVKCNSIAAKVNEKNNIYNVVVNIFNNHIYNYCNCSTDSPGCSHVIATLLEWLGTAEVNSDNGKSLLFQNLNLLDIIKEESPKIVMLAYKMVTENRVNIQTHGEYVIIGTVGEENVKIGSTIGSYTPRYYCSCSCNKLESRCIHSLAVKLAILQKYSPEEVPGNFDIELEELLYYERLNNLSAVLCEPDSDKIKKQYQIFFRIGVQEKALKLELCKAQFLKNGGFGKLTPATENFVDQNFDSFPTDIKHVLILMKLSLKKQVLYKEQKNNNMIITEFEDNADIEILNCLKTIYLENPGIFKNAEFPEEKAYMEIHLLPNIDGSSFDLKLFAKMKHSIYGLRDDRVILLDNKTRMWITVTRKDSIQVIYQLQGQKTFTELIKYLLKLNNMRIRQEDIIEFIEKYYISLSSIGNVVLPEKYRIEAIDNVDPIPRIYLKEFGNQLTMDLKFGYCKSSEAAYGTRHDIVIRDKDSNLRCIKRKLKREEELYLMLHEHGVIRKYGVLTPDIDPYEWLFFKTEELIKNGFEIYGQQKLVNYRTTTASPNMSLYVSNGIDWFDLKGEVSYGQEKIDLSKLMHALVKNEKYVKLSNGVMGAIPEKWLNRMTQLSGLMKKKGDRIFAARSQIGIIETLLEISTKSQIDDKVNTILDKFKEFETIEAVDLPENFNGELREYQKAGYDWLNFLKNFSFGGCLADDMGLGKTVQVLTLLLKSKDTGNTVPSLVVVPTSLIFNWVDEVKKFTPSLKVSIHHGNDRGASLEMDSDIILTSYGILRNDLRIFKKQKFYYIILDESQMIKNPVAKTSRAAYSLKSDHKLIMTGTPIENSSMDLWSQFAFLNPGLLGDFEYFKKSFIKGIEKDKDRDKVNSLRRIINPFILSRKKNNVAKDLPAKQITTLYCNMDDAQRDVYNGWKERIRLEISDLINKKGFVRSRMKILQGLIKLRQICNHPELIDSGYSGKSGKLELLMTNVKTVIQEGHKVLIFSSFVKMLKVIKKELDESKIRYSYLDGHTRKRKEVIDEFQTDDEIQIFLISIKAGGLGLNLTAADYVFIVDPWWNPAVEMQAIDRTHRIGQDKKVFVYKMITKDSIEEKILLLQKNKLDLVNDVIVPDEGILKKMKHQDIIEMFK